MADIDVAASLGGWREPWEKARVYFQTHFLESTNKIRSGQFQMAAWTSFLFILVTGLYAFSFVGMTPIWTHPTANLLVWLIVLGVPLLIYTLTFFLADMIVSLQHIASDVLGIMTPGEKLAPAYEARRNAYFLDAATPKDRKAIYAHFWSLIVVFFYGAIYLLRWYTEYHRLGSTDELSNGYAIVQWQSFLFMMTAMCAVVVFTTVRGLGAYHSVFGTSMWSAGHFLSKYLKGTASSFGTKSSVYSLSSNQKVD
jgi:hypothetical protein